MGEGSNAAVGLLFFALEAWPFLLAGGLLFGAGAWSLRRQPGVAERALGFLLALAASALLLPVGLVGALVAGEQWSSWQQSRGEAAVTTVLAAPAVLDGIALPAGAVVRWADPSRRRVSDVRLDGPRGAAGGPVGESTASVLGLAGVYGVYRQDDDHWQLGVERAQEVDGWPCDAPHVFVTTAGRLRSCRLSGPFAFGGWTLPARTEVSLGGPYRAGFLDLVLPAASPLEAPHGIGPLPVRVALNRDGSLAEAIFPREAPLPVPGGPALWGHVRFRYAASAEEPREAEGRDRGPLAVSGFDPAGPSPDGWSGPRIEAPWPVR